MKLFDTKAWVQDLTLPFVFMLQPFIKVFIGMLILAFAVSLFHKVNDISGKEYFFRRVKDQFHINILDLMSDNIENKADVSIFRVLFFIKIRYL